VTQDSLKHLSLGELYDLMLLIIDEYSALQKRIHNTDVAEVKKGEIQLIQKVINERKSKLNPTL
jgi:hypothetical protein